MIRHEADTCSHNSYSTVLGFLACTIRQEKETKGIWFIIKKTFLYADDMIYIDNFKKSTKKFIQEIISSVWLQDR